MSLTNEIKRVFPWALHYTRYFKGVKLRYPRRDLSKMTDVRMDEVEDSEIESPPLSDFDDDARA